jgi:hypothetical protein
MFLITFSDYKIQAILSSQQKRKAPEESDVAESSDCMITSPGFAVSPMLTPVSGKAVKTSKSKTKNNKAGPQTPTSNVGSPLNPPTPVGTCRYDSSLGDNVTLCLQLFFSFSSLSLRHCNPTSIIYK